MWSDLWGGWHFLKVSSIFPRAKLLGKSPYDTIRLIPYSRCLTQEKTHPIFVAYFAMSDAFNLCPPNFCSHRESLPSMLKRGTIKIAHQSLQIYSSPIKDSDSYHFDTIEEEIMNEQSLLPNNKSIRSKKGQEGKRNTKHSTLPTKPTANKTSNTKKGRRHSKTYGSASSTPMPLRLAQYKNEDFAGPFYLVGEVQSAYSIDGVGRNLR